MYTPKTTPDAYRNSWTEELRYYSEKEIGFSFRKNTKITHKLHNENVLLNYLKFHNLFS